MKGKRTKLEIIRSEESGFPRAVLISDSAFLGFHLSQELLEKGAAIFYFKNQHQSDGELNKLKQLPNFRDCRGQLPKDFDYLFHLNIKEDKKAIFTPFQSMKEAAKVGAKYLLVTPWRERYPRNYFSSFTRISNIDWRIIHFNGLYGPSWEENSILEKLFSQVTRGKILIAGDGEEQAYPLYIADLVQGILRAMFSRDSNGRLYILTGLEKISLLDFAWRIKQLAGQKFEVAYVAPQFSNTWIIGSFILERVKKSWWRLVYKPKIDLPSGIRLTLETVWDQEAQGILGKVLARVKQALILPFTRRKVIKPPAQEKQPSALAALKKGLYQAKEGKEPISPLPKKTGWRILKIRIAKPKIALAKIALFGLLGLSLSLVVFSPFILLLGCGLLGFQKLQTLEEKIDKGEFQSLVKEAKASQKYFLTSRKILWQASPIISFVGWADEAEKLEGLFSIALDLAQSIESATQALVKAQALGNIVFDNALGNPKEELEGLLVSLSQTEERLAFAQAQADKYEKFNFPLAAGLDKKLDKLKEQLPLVRSQVSSTRQLLILSPDFLAFEGKKSYLLLLQNNMELRPTGGFIGSYGLLSFEQGRLLDLKVEDVYSADGQLKGHVEPPAPLKKYLGQGNWYLRDSNFSPDFPTAAAQAEWFLEKETGKRVDGTIAVNLEFVKSLLAVSGPVYLPEYKEEITASNLFERAEYHSEVDFFPGSTAKRSFLTTLSNFLFEKLKGLSAVSCLQLFARWQKNLEEKDVMLAFHEPSLVKKIRFLGWNGEVRKVSFSKTSQFQGPGLTDYLMVVDTNVGVNKANYFLTREVNFEATILKEGEVVNQLTLVYHNSSPSESWPGGTYKNYLRLLLPADVKKVRVKQTKVGEDKVQALDAKKIDQETAFEKNIFGFLVAVPPGESQKLVITYQREEKLPLNQSVLDYVLFWQKQSGTKDDPLAVKINFPAYFKPVKIMPQGLWKPQNVTFEGELAKDTLFAIEFSR